MRTTDWIKSVCEEVKRKRKILPRPIQHYHFYLFLLTNSIEATKAEGCRKQPHRCVLPGLTGR